MKRCAIIGGAPINNYSEIMQNISNEDFIICADSGLIHARNMNLSVDLIVGDFDSFTGTIIEKCEIIQLPACKDDTDTHYAAKTALQRGYRDFTFIGVTGGRLDHTLANLATLNFLSKERCNCTVFDEMCIIQILRESSLILDKSNGTSFSVFTVTEESSGIFESGVKYPLNDAVITNSFPLGISNEIVDKKACISIKTGAILIIQNKN